MILTKDNLLRFVREKKYVIPSDVATSFETSSMIASAALSELAKDKLVAITYLKLSSTPYYYDPKQKESLCELGEKHFSKYEKDVFEKIKNQQVINDNSLSIQERLAIDRIKDFAIPLEIEFNERVLKFWIWYLRDIQDIRKQILEALNPKNSKPQYSPKSEDVKRTVEETVAPKKETSQNENSKQYINNQNVNKKDENQFSNYETKAFSGENKEYEENKNELFIENYFKNNYLKIESKNKQDNTIKYSTSLTVNKMKIHFDCIYFLKKPTESQIISFYTSSPKPKLVFLENAPKKLFTLADNLVNLEIINI